MKSIAKMEEQLADLRKQSAAATDPEIKASLEEKIDFIQDDIDEIEEEDRDNAAYEEMTGTTPQDIYLEQNHHAIVQSEMIETYRNEF